MPKVELEFHDLKVTMDAGGEDMEEMKSSALGCMMFLIQERIKFQEVMREIEAASDDEDRSPPGDEREPTAPHDQPDAGHDAPEMPDHSKLITGYT